MWSQHLSEQKEAEHLKTKLGLSVIFDLSLVKQRVKSEKSINKK